MAYRGQQQARSGIFGGVGRTAARGLGSVLAALACGVATVAAGSEADPSPAEIQQYRQAALQMVLTDFPASRAAIERGTCAAGGQPEAIRKSRVEGWRSPPDAADLCAAIGLRMGRDGTLLQPYRELLSKLTGGSTGYEQLPAAMAAAALKGGTDRVAIGNGKAALLTPAWVWDAGFTVAYQGRSALPVGAPSIAALKPVAERCLAQQERDLGLCYSTGYMYGLSAVHGALQTALAVHTP